jgi:hypothetical protein
MDLAKRWVTWLLLFALLPAVQPVLGGHPDGDYEPVRPAGAKTAIPQDAKVAQEPLRCEARLKGLTRARSALATTGSRCLAARRRHAGPRPDSTPRASGPRSGVSATGGTDSFRHLHVRRAGLGQVVAS